jgi:hypothetical protein
LVFTDFGDAFREDFPPHGSALSQSEGLSSPLNTAPDGMIGLTSGGIFAGDFGAADTLGPVAPHMFATGIICAVFSSSVVEDAVCGSIGTLTGD